MTGSRLKQDKQTEAEMMQSFGKLGETGTNRRKFLSAMGVAGLAAIAASVPAALTPQTAEASGNNDLYVNAKDFGAVGNGIADDTAAIQSAIHSIDPAIGGTVFLPAGKFNISHTLTLTSNQRIWGAGNLSSRLVVTADVTAIEIVTTTAFPKIGRTGVRDVFIHFLNNNDTWTKGHGIYMYTPSNASSRSIWKTQIENVQMYQVPQSGIHMTSPLSVSSNYIAETYFRAGRLRNGGNAAGLDFRHSCYNSAHSAL